MFPHTLAKNCLLRLLEESDAAELYALIDADREYLAQWLPWAANQTLEDTAAFIAMTQREVADVGDFYFQYAIVRDHEIIGVVGYQGLNRTHRRISIGYWLREAEQGQGTMTLAVRVLVEHALRAMDLNRVEIRVAPANYRSRAIPERLGFREEGTLRQAEHVGDGYLDNVVYGMVASDWT